jgi:diguanylate cyclase (GGDEF)-like protein
MGWTLVVILNGTITWCYLLIAYIILRGLVTTHQVRTNPLALATAAIFLSCAVHHGEHAAHLLLASEYSDLRGALGAPHDVAVDAVGAAIALIYLSLRRRYGALLRTPAMFEDQVRRAAALQLEAIAYTDALTGLANRAALQRLVDTLETGPVVHPLVAYIDLDGFKAVNDLHGHAAGDRVLQSVAEHLVAVLPAGLQAFRLGGDEFLVVAPDESLASLEELQELIRSVFSGLTVPVRDGSTFSVRASTGYAVARPGEHVEQVIRRADARMYTAKAEAQERPSAPAFVVVPPAQRSDLDLQRRAVQ